MNFKNRKALADTHKIAYFLIKLLKYSYDLIPYRIFLKDESVEGILTILCNHSFHGDCLVQWSDARYLLRYLRFMHLLSYRT